MDIANKILENLYDRRNGFFTLEEIGKTVGANYETVERALVEVSNRGHRFERHPAEGIKLVRPTVMDAYLIERGLPVKHIGRNVICFDEVDSTNDIAFDAANQADGQALVITAQYQRKGRGRFNRKWIAKPNSAILASVLLHKSASILPHESLTIAAGLAVAEGIEQITNLRPSLRWPNDVIIDDAKLAGVLVEVRYRGAARYVVIGFGVNVLSAPPMEVIEKKATCLAEAMAPMPIPEPIDILRSILIRIDYWIEQLGKGNVQHLHQQWCKRCDMINRLVRVISSGQCFTGRVIDVNPLEGLTLMTPQGQCIRLPAETSTLVD